MECDNESVVFFKHPTNRFGKTPSDTKVVVPADIKSDSILNALIERRVNVVNDNTHYVIVYLIKNRHLPQFSTLLQPIKNCTLNDLMTFRSQLHRPVNLKKIPNSYVARLFIGLAKIDTKLSCGRRIRDWGRFKSDAKNNPRQIVEESPLWNTIKNIDDVAYAKKKVKDEVSEINDKYFNAAWKNINDYLSLFDSTKEWAQQFSDGKLTNSAVEYRFKRLKTKLGYTADFTGDKKLYLNEEWRGAISSRLLISVLVICKLRRPLNTDVWLSLRSENFDFKRTYVSISRGVKNKTKIHVNSFKVLNRDREFFTALKILHEHMQVTQRLIRDYNIQTIREPLAFDFLTTRSRKKSSNKLNLPSDFQYLRGVGYKRFCSDNELPYLSLDTLRNLSATKRFLDGDDLRDIQHILGHASLTTTERYLEQHVVSIYLSHNILVFMRQFENEAVVKFDDTGVFSDVVESENSTDKYFLLGDGSSCIDPHNSPDAKQDEGELCNGKLCHAGCSNNKIVLNKQSIWQALVKREEYRTTWYGYSSHAEKFGAFEAKKILFNALLCQHIAKHKPTIYTSMMVKIKQRINSVELA